jgi:hypothetical protein
MCRLFHVRRPRGGGWLRMWARPRHPTAIRAPQQVLKRRRRRVSRHPQPLCKQPRQLRQAAARQPMPARLPQKRRRQPRQLPLQLRSRTRRHLPNRQRGLQSGRAMPGPRRRPREQRRRRRRRQLPQRLRTHLAWWRQRTRPSQRASREVAPRLQRQLLRRAAIAGVQRHCRGTPRRLPLRSRPPQLWPQRRRRGRLAAAARRSWKRPGPQGKPRPRQGFAQSLGQVVLPTGRLVSQRKLRL